jgi:hypothetical protein
MFMTSFNFQLRPRRKPRQLSHPEISILECDILFNNNYKIPKDFISVI